VRLQLWSYNYAPEPTGIAPVSKVWAEAMAERGHEVEVVAAFPHYPEPIWEHPRRPYRETIDGIGVTRLPLWVGRDNARQRIRQELSFALAQMAAIPALRRPDAKVVVSPSFPALAPAIANARLRRVPWILWLHDILPDGAAATGLVDEGPILRASRRLERLAYREADRIVVLSKAFSRNLEGKDVPTEKIELIYDPATRVPQETEGSSNGSGEICLLSMGNIGFSQNLAEVVRSFEQAPERNRDVRFVITGNGMAAPGVAAEVHTGRVEMAGLVASERLEQELQSATLGLVSQKHGGEEFNIPSKLMNFMMYGVPVVASVDPESEVARIVRASGGGWVVDNRDADQFAAQLEPIVADRSDIADRAESARSYAQAEFSVEAFAEQFDRVLRQAHTAPTATSDSPSLVAP
jgi:colanic acid biosynthesis glycosyl transferase WcaI